MRSLFRRYAAAARNRLLPPARNAEALASSLQSLFKKSIGQRRENQMRPYYYLGGNRALTQLSIGNPFFVNTDDRGITTWIILGGLWETFVDDILYEVAQPGMTFVDIGANMGYYTVKIGSKVGAAGKVYSFEPNPELNSFLDDNININGFGPRARAFKCALGDARGKATLYFPYENMGGGSLAGPGLNSVAVEVAVDTLDDCIAAGERVDLVKIDAEGFEPKILSGGRRVMAENPNLVMVLEVNLLIWRMFCEPGAVLRELLGDSREIFAIHTDGRLVPYQDADTFLARVDDNFVAYCLVAPKAAQMGRRFAAKIAR